MSTRPAATLPPVGRHLAAPEAVVAAQDRQVVAARLVQAESHRDDVHRDLLGADEARGALTLAGSGSRRSRGWRRVVAIDRRVVAHAGAEQVDAHERHRRAPTNQVGAEPAAQPQPAAAAAPAPASVSQTISDASRITPAPERVEEPAGRVAKSQATFSAPPEVAEAGAAAERPRTSNGSASRTRAAGRAPAGGAAAGAAARAEVVEAPARQQRDGAASRG